MIDKLYQEVTSFDNVNKAYHAVSLGRSIEIDYLRFDLDKEEIITDIIKDLREYTYTPSPTVLKIIHEPKTREISIPAYRDRVVHNALVQVTLPYFTDYFHRSSFACLTGRGPLVAAKYYQGCIRSALGRWGEDFYIVSLDFRKYFASIDREVLKTALRRIFSPTYNRDILWLFSAIIDGYERSGLPLGFLTSQQEANLVATPLDYYVTDTLGYPLYLRYMDDERVLVHTRAEAKELLYKLDSFCWEKLHLALSPEKTLVRPWRGADTMCGYIIHPHYLERKPSTIKRGVRRILKKERDYLAGKITLSELRDSALALNALYKDTCETSHPEADRVLRSYPR